MLLSKRRIRTQRANELDLCTVTSQHTHAVLILQWKWGPQTSELAPLGPR